MMIKKSWDRGRLARFFRRGFLSDAAGETPAVPFGMGIRGNRGSLSLYIARAVDPNGDDSPDKIFEIANKPAAFYNWRRGWSVGYR
jgi:hypothetical protein